MALTTSSVVALRSINSSIGNSSRGIENAAERIIQRLNSDENYKKFVEGTEKGAKLNEEFQKLVALLVSQLVAGALLPLTSTISRFADKQDLLNKN